MLWQNPEIKLRSEPRSQWRKVHINNTLIGVQSCDPSVCWT